MSLRTLWSRWRPLRRRLDRLAWPLGLVGLAGVAVFNWRQWQRDKALLARVKEPPPLPPLEEWPALPQVSVLVAAWNEAGFIERHIESFRALRYPHKELVLCAGGNDGTYELARQYEGATVKVLEQQPGEGKQRALARGFPLTEGSIIFLTDADCLLDDDAFGRTLYPVLIGEEQAATGGSRPRPELLAHPLVVVQAASDLRMYSDMNAPPYLPGLLGRNAAVSRELLEKTRGLERPAPTGTDYVLAKSLVASGVRIRQVRSSQIQTTYPTATGAYIHQQRRWLRNVAIHGKKFDAHNETFGALLLSLSSLVFLLLPGTAFLLGPWIFVPWLLVVGLGFGSRLRQLLFMNRATCLQFDRRQYVSQFTSLFVDLVAWSLSLLDYLFPEKRRRW